MYRCPRAKWVNPRIIAGTFWPQPRMPSGPPSRYDQTVRPGTVPPGPRSQPTQPSARPAKASRRDSRGPAHSSQVSPALSITSQRGTPLTPLIGTDADQCSATEATSILASCPSQR